MSYTDMSYTEMSYTAMSYTDMSYTVMSYTVMSYTDMSYTDMSLVRASCSPNASQQSIWASQRRAAEDVLTASRGKNSRHSCWFSL